MASVPKSAHPATIDIANPPRDLRRFTVEDYHRMAEAGLFRDETEFVEGVIYDKHARPIDRHRFNVEDYYRLAEMGILFSDERLELIDGEIFEMRPIGSNHAACVDRFNSELSERLRGRVIVRVQNPIRLSGRHEQQPDISILKRRADFYSEDHPRATDIYFVIKVMDSSAVRDRQEKLQKYAQAGIAEVWLADLNEDRLEAHRTLLNGIYTEVQVRISGQSISPEAFPDVVLPIDEILG